MAVAVIERPSWPDRPVRGHNRQGRDLPDRAQPDQGPAQEVIGEMAWLLRDTRSSMFLGGGVLSAITIAIGLEAAFSGHAMRPGVLGAVNAGLLSGLLLCWLLAVVMLARRRTQVADTWTYIAAAYFLLWTVVILLGL
jgi:hypothetical protein